MEHTVDTIAAVATSMSAPAGISIVRVSGSDALAVAAMVFTPARSDRPVRDMDGYTGAYGKVRDAQGAFDEAVLWVYRAPKSYTGEDVAEICCHGGAVVTRRLLRACLEAGARLAQAGEFTRRAVLHGKLTLPQAEAVMGLIGAQNELSAKCALRAYEGAAYQEICAVRDALLHIIAQQSAFIDYPDEDIDDMDAEEMLSRMNDAAQRLQRLLRNYDVGEAVREGIPTVIVGKPNTGKSTLMNLLAGYDKSIVTDVAGTTRDVVEGTLCVGDVLLRAADTAGIRDADNAVERIGVDRSLSRLRGAALILAVFDASRPFDEEDLRVLEEIRAVKTMGVHAIAVYNKTDLDCVLELPDGDAALFDAQVSLCAKSGGNLEALIHAIEGAADLGDIRMGAAPLASERQRDCAARAFTFVMDAARALRDGVTVDAVCSTLDLAVGALLELTGEVVSDAVVSQVFASFCVGK